MPGTDELSERLRALADGPIDAEQAYAQVMRRHRRRRARHLGAVVVAAAMLAGGVVALSGRGDEQRVQVVDHGVDDAPGADRDVDATDDGTAPRPSRALLLYGDSGISVLSAGAQSEIWPEPVSVAFPDRLEGVVFQDAGGGPIRWLPDPADRSGASVIVEASAVLHAVVDTDIGPNVLFTRRSGDGEEQLETLFSHSLLSRVTQRVLDTGGAESGLGAVARQPDGTLALSTCHLQCAIWREDDYSAGSDSAEPLVGPDWIAGFDIAGDTLAYVRYTFAPEEARFTDAELVVADLAGRTQAEVPLPFENDHGAARVDLDPEGARAVVSVPAVAGGSQSAVLVGDVRDTTPSIDDLGAVGASFAGG